MRRILWNLSGALVVAVLQTAAARAEILVGMAGALTGPNAYQGEQQQQGVEMAVADLSAAGGLFGQQLKIVSVDDACDDGQAAAAAYKLIEAKVSVVIGHQCSGASVAAAAIYARVGIVQMTPASTAPRLTEAGHTNVFRMCGRDDQQGATAGDFLAERWGGARIAILHDGSIYGRGLADETRRRLHGRGLTEALYEELAPGQSDYSPLIAKLKEAGVEVAYFGGYYREAALLIRDADEQGYRMQLVSGDSIASEAFLQVTGDAGEGTLFTSFRDPRRTAIAQPVVERFRQIGFEPEGYTLYSYGAVQTWALAAMKVGSADPKAVAAALRTGEFDTILGRISFDQKGDVRQPGFEWFVWRKGQYVPLE